MESVDKMNLQERAAEGRDATFLLTERFSGKWLDEVKAKTLDALCRALPAELLTVQADYKAALRFYESLRSTERRGREAMKKLYEDKDN